MHRCWSQQHFSLRSVMPDGGFAYGYAACSPILALIVIPNLSCRLAYVYRCIARLSSMADAEMETEQPQQQEAGPSSKAKGPKGGKRFEIKKWNAVAMWSWAICTDTCAICRNNLYEPSIEYQANPTGMVVAGHCYRSFLHAEFWVSLSARSQ